MANRLSDDYLSRDYSRQSAPVVDLGGVNFQLGNINSDVRDIRNKTNKALTGTLGRIESNIQDVDYDMGQLNKGVNRLPKDIAKENSAMTSRLISQFTSLTKDFVQGTANTIKDTAADVIRDVNGKFGFEKGSLLGRVGAMMGGPLGMMIGKSISDSGLTDRLKDSLSNAMVSIKDRMVDAFHNLREKDNEMFEDALEEQEEAFENSIAPHQKSIDDSVKSIESMLKTGGINGAGKPKKQATNRNDNLYSTVADISKNGIRKTFSKDNAGGDFDASGIGGMSGPISALMDSIENLNQTMTVQTDEPGGLKGMFNNFKTLLSPAFGGGMYVNDIPKSTNPFVTITAGIVQIYRWQRLYGEAAFRQLNELIQIGGGKPQKIIGKNPFVFDFVAKNLYKIQHLVALQTQKWEEQNGGKLKWWQQGIKFLTNRAINQRSIDPEEYEIRKRQQLENRGEAFINQLLINKEMGNELSLKELLKRGVKTFGPYTDPDIHMGGMSAVERNEIERKYGQNMARPESGGRVVKETGEINEMPSKSAFESFKDLGRGLTSAIPFLGPKLAPLWGEFRELKVDPEIEAKVKADQQRREQARIDRIMADTQPEWGRLTGESMPEEKHVLRQGHVIIEGGLEGILDRLDSIIECVCGGKKSAYGEIIDIVEDAEDEFSESIQSNLPAVISSIMPTMQSEFLNTMLSGKFGNMFDAVQQFTSSEGPKLLSGSVQQTGQKLLPGNVSQIASSEGGPGGAASIGRKLLEAPRARLMLPAPSEESINAGTAEAEKVTALATIANTCTAIQRYSQTTALATVDQLSTLGNIREENEKQTSVAEDAAKLAKDNEKSKKFKDQFGGKATERGGLMGKIGGIVRLLTSMSLTTIMALIAFVTALCLNPRGTLGFIKWMVSSLPNFLKTITMYFKSVAMVSVGIAKGMRSLRGFVMIMAKTAGRFQGLFKGLAGIFKTTGAGSMKVAGKAMGKRIPIIGGLLSILFGISRIRKKDYFGGMLEFISGISSLAALFPPIAPAAMAISLIIDSFLILRDLDKMMKPDKHTTSSGVRNTKSRAFMKTLPLIGTYFNIIDAVREFKAGNIMRGVAESASAITTLAPGLWWVTAFIQHMLYDAREAELKGEPVKVPTSKTRAMLKLFPIIGTYLSIVDGIREFKRAKFGRAFLEFSNAILTFAPGLFWIQAGIQQILYDSRKEEETGKPIKVPPTKTRAALKLIPGIGTWLSITDSVREFKHGKVWRGIMELGSAIYSFFPGLGTLYAGIMQALMYDDRHADATGNRTKSGVSNTLTRNVLKTLPLLGTWFGIIDGIREFKAGNFWRGTLEFTNAILSLVPVLGTIVVSVIQTLMYDDRKEEITGQKPKVPATASRAFLKMLPGIGTIISIIDAIREFKQGNIGRGAFELTSSVVSLVPGLGTIVAGFIQHLLNDNRKMDGIKDKKKKYEVNNGFFHTYLKLVPGVGLFLSIYDAVKEFQGGHVVRGVTELAVAVLSTGLPGPGTWISAFLLKLLRNDRMPTEKRRKTAQGTLRSHLKVIPVIGSVLALIDAIHYYKKGDTENGTLELVTALSSLAPGVGTMIAFFVQSLMRARRMGKIKLHKSTGNGIIDAFVEIIRYVSGILFKIVGGIGKFLWSIVKTTGKLVFSLFKGLFKVIKFFVWSIPKYLFKLLVGTIKLVGKSLLGIFKLVLWKIPEAIFNGIYSLMEALFVGLPTRIWEWIKGLFSGKKEGKGFFGKLIDKVVSGIVTAVKFVFVKLPKMIVSGIASVFKGLVKFIGKTIWYALNGIFAYIKTVFFKIPALFLKIGTTIIGGIFKGIKWIGEKIWEGIKALPGLIWDAIMGLGKFLAGLPGKLMGAVWNGAKGLVKGAGKLIMSPFRAIANYAKEKKRKAAEVDALVAGMPEEVKEKLGKKKSKELAKLIQKYGPEEVIPLFKEVGDVKTVEQLLKSKVEGDSSMEVYRLCQLYPDQKDNILGMVKAGRSIEEIKKVLGLKDETHGIDASWLQSSPEELEEKKKEIEYRLQLVANEMAMLQAKEGGMNSEDERRLAELQKLQESLKQEVKLFENMSGKTVAQPAASAAPHPVPSGTAKAVSEVSKEAKIEARNEADSVYNKPSSMSSVQSGMSSSASTASGNYDLREEYEKNKPSTITYSIITNHHGITYKSTGTFSTKGMFYDPIVETHRGSVGGVDFIERKHKSGKISRRTSVISYEGDDPDLWTPYNGKPVKLAKFKKITDGAGGEKGSLWDRIKSFGKKTFASIKENGIQKWASDTVENLKNNPKIKIAKTIGKAALTVAKWSPAGLAVRGAIGVGKGILKAGGWLKGLFTKKPKETPMQRASKIIREGMQNAVKQGIPRADAFEVLDQSISDLDYNTEGKVYSSLELSNLRQYGRWVYKKALYDKEHSTEQHSKNIDASDIQQKEKKSIGQKLKSGIKIAKTIGKAALTVAKWSPAGLAVRGAIGVGKGILKAGKWLKGLFKKKPKDSPMQQIGKMVRETMQQAALNGVSQADAFETLDQTIAGLENSEDGNSFSALELKHLRKYGRMVYRKALYDKEHPDERHGDDEVFTVRNGVASYESRKTRQVSETPRHSTKLNEVFDNYKEKLATDRRERAKENKQLLDGYGRISESNSKSLSNAFNTASNNAAYYVTNNINNVNNSGRDQQTPLSRPFTDVLLAHCR